MFNLINIDIFRPSTAIYTFSREIWKRQATIVLQRCFEIAECQLASAPFVKQHLYHP